MFCKLILPFDEILKLSNLPDTFEDLHKTISQKLEGKISNDFVLKYKDSEEELITLCCDDDIKTAIITSQNENIKTLRIFVFPVQEAVIAPRQDLNLNTLPGIPETLEKSRSSITESSQLGSFKKLPEELPSIKQLSPQKTFDFRKLPKSTSLVFDDLETINSMTPFSERFAEPTKEKKIFTFQRFNTIDSMPELREFIKSPNPESVLSEEQVKWIDELVEKKLGNDFQEKAANFARDLVSKFIDELNFFNLDRNNSFQHGYTQKNNIRSGVRRHTLMTTKESSQGNPFCVNCDKEIFDTNIKYICLSCTNFICCEPCEGVVDHPHSLLKLRPTHQHEQEFNFFSSSNVDNTSQTKPNLNLGLQRSNSRHITAAPALTSAGSERNLANITKLYENIQNTNAQLPLPTPPRKNPPLRRGSSMGSIMTGPSSCSKLTRVIAEHEAKYKANVNKSTVFDFISVKPGKNFTVQVIIQNTGESKWIDPVKLVCINGIYKGSEIEIKSLQPKEDQNLTMNLQAPDNSGRYLSQWKLHYEEDGMQRAFGKAIYVDFEVSQSEDMNTENEEEEETAPRKVTRRQTQQIKQRENIEGNVQETKEAHWQLLKDLNCTESVYLRAKMLNDMFPGEIQEKVNFIRKFTSSLDINEIVSAYLSKMGNNNKRRSTWASNMGISKQLSSHS